MIDEVYVYCPVCDGDAVIIDGRARAGHFLLVCDECNVEIIPRGSPDTFQETVEALKTKVNDEEMAYQYGDGYVFEEWNSND